MSNLSNLQYEFEILLSFAGAQRSYARAIHDILASNGIRVFLDEEFQHEIWGKDLGEYLATTYTERGAYCVALVSEEYANGAYPRHEKRAALARGIFQASEYLLLLRFDDAEIEGIPKTTAYMDVREVGIIGGCEWIIKKLRGPTAVLELPPTVTVPRIPVGRIPAPHISKYLLEICQRQSTALFGVLVYDESTAELRKLLRDSDYWAALDIAGGTDLEIFAIRDKEDSEVESLGDTLSELTGVSMSRFTSRRHYFSRLLSDYFGISRTRLAYPALILFGVSAGRVDVSRILPLSRGTLEQTFLRLQALLSTLASVIREWRDDSTNDAAKLWKSVDAKLIATRQIAFIGSAPVQASDALLRLMSFVEA